MTRRFFFRILTSSGLLILADRFKNYFVFKNKFLVVTRADQVGSEQKFDTKADFWIVYNDVAALEKINKLKSQRKVLFTDSFLNPDFKSVTLVKIYESESVYTELMKSFSSKLEISSNSTSKLFYQVVEKRVI